MPTNELLAEVDFLRAKLAKKDKRLVEAEGLLKRYYNLLDEGNLVEPELCFEADELHELTEIFLSTPTTSDMVLVRREFADRLLVYFTCDAQYSKVSQDFRDELRTVLEKPC